MKPYYKVIIKENNEPLVPIPLENFAVESPHPYEKLGANYNGLSPYFLRKTVVDYLIKAQEYLQIIKPNWKIKIFDAYRPVEVQKFMVNYAFNDLIKSRNLNLASLTSIELEELWAQVYKMWALPSEDPLMPPPHSTGGAIDITLVNELGETIDMGGAIDEIAEKSYPDYYINSSEGQKYHQSRELLRMVMAKANFQRHPFEWWHFSYGDQLYVWQCSQHNINYPEVAIYGRAL
jgi:zinc D-Ala-D-Ala dipeptidase